ncbi:MAG: pilus assembly protein [Methylococcaceae bacterium]|nr:pilus assembly protein [Methylococcaceae bacterium]
MKLINSSNKQKGAILVLSLIILLIMTLLGVSVMSVNILDEKMVNNDRQYKEALHAAELTLREAEKLIDPDATYNTALTTSSTVASNRGLYLSTSAPTGGWWKGVNWNNADQVKESSSSTANKSIHYIIEQLPAAPADSKEAGLAVTKKYYRITSRAIVTGSNAKVMLQTTYKK